MSEPKLKAWPSVGRIKVGRRPSTESLTSLASNSDVNAEFGEEVLPEGSRQQYHAKPSLPVPILVASMNRTVSKASQSNGHDPEIEPPLKRPKRPSMVATPDNDDEYFEPARIISTPGVHRPPRCTPCLDSARRRKRSISSFFRSPMSRPSDLNNGQPSVSSARSLQRRVKTAESDSTIDLLASIMHRTPGGFTTADMDPGIDSRFLPENTVTILNRRVIKETDPDTYIHPSIENLNPRSDQPIVGGTSPMPAQPEISRGDETLHSPGSQSLSEGDDGSEYIDGSDPESESENEEDMFPGASCVSEEDSIASCAGKAVDLLLRLFTFDDFGCSPQAHGDIRKQQCPEHDDVPCSGLDSTYSHRDMMIRRAGDVQSIGLSSTTFPTPIEMNRNRFLRDDQLRRIFEGTSTSERPPRRICIHKDHHNGVAPELEYDIDAFLATADSFEGFRAGETLQLSFTKECRFNISSDLHLRVPVSVHDKRGRLIPCTAQIRHVPHLYLGSVDAFTNSAVFVMFPRLYDNEITKGRKKNKRSSWLTDKHSQQFLDVWLSACRSHTTSFLRQAVPPSVDCTEGRARAKAVEHRSSQRKDPQKQLRHYPMPVASAQAAWSEACEIFKQDTHGLGVFQDAYLFVNTKNTKLQGPAPTLLETLITFREKMNRVFHRDHMKFYADIGAKVVPVYTGPDTSSNGAEPQAQRASSRDTLLSDDLGLGPATTTPSTYLWKACCLEQLYSRIKNDAFGCRPGKKQTYNNGFLRDATTLTVEPPAKSWVRKGGVLYFQAYNSAKEIEDAQKVYPFDRPLLANLALAADIVGPLTLSVDRGSLIQSYCGSKARLNREYRDWRSTPLGARFEARVSDDIIDGMCDRLQVASARSRAVLSLGSTTPEFLWCIPTSKWCDFMHGNYDKITSLLEMIILSGPRGGVTLPTSQLLFAMFVYLRGFRNSNPARRSLLWAENVGNMEGQQMGFNLKHSLARYGFGWLAPHVDWQGLRLLPHAVGKLVGCGGTIGTGYHKSMRQTQDQRAIMELLYKHIGQAEVNSARTNVAMKTLAHYILRQYRRDVLQFLAKSGELHTEYKATSEHDRVVFCHTGLSSVLVQQPYYVSGGRVCGANDASVFFELLMGTGKHSRRRDHFDGKKQKEWRQMLWKTKGVFDSDVNLEKAWARCLRKEFERYMFSIPYPDPSGVFVETHTPTSQRKFYAAGYINGNWQCVNDRPRLDNPPKYPKTLWMSLEDLDTHLITHPDRT